jgi:sec-independent protein translocase protein TatA
MLRLENPLFWIILAVVALIIFGPRRLPELGEGLGKAIKEFRKATTEVGEGLKGELRKPDPPASTTGTYTAPAGPTGATPGEPPAATPPPEPPKT